MSACQHRSISTFCTESGDPSGLWACAECNRKFVPIDRELALEQENAKLREVVLECLAVMERTAHSTSDRKIAACRKARAVLQETER